MSVVILENVEVSVNRTEFSLQLVVEDGKGKQSNRN